MLPAKDVLSTLIAALYDAAGDPSLWPVFLRQVALATQSTQAGILLHDIKHGEHSVSLQWGVDPAAVRSYDEYYGNRDVWTRKAAPLVHTGWLGTSEELSSLEELVRSEFYNDYLKPNEMGQAMWGVIENSPSRLINIGLYRDLRRPFQDKDLELLRFLAPHLQRAFRLHIKFTELKTRAEGLQHAIDMLPSGVFFLGADAGIVHMNRTAAKILAKNDGLIAARGRLAAERAAESSELENLIAQARDTSRGTGLRSAGGVAISRRLRGPLHVLVTPVRNISLDTPYPVLAIAFVTDPSQRVRPASDVLRTLFGLTPAECRVALLLAEGHAPPDIAVLIGISTNTLKTQLASIYRKTGTSRQAQLVRTLSQLVIAPLSANED